ncbi:hypothetical protein SFC65_20365 [Priestia filamentosa]|uniref:hypothetical protein n=1 Tax=Priestia filamentosa TaxID=1402861 RepID=UPI003981B582
MKELEQKGKQQVENIKKDINKGKHQSIITTRNNEQLFQPYYICTNVKCNNRAKIYT